MPPLSLSCSRAPIWLWCWTRRSTVAGNRPWRAEGGIRQQYPHIKVQARWSYLYRTIDRNGHLIDVRLSNTRDLAAAEAFFRSARRVTGVVAVRITTDGHDGYPRAIRAVFGDQVTHRTNRYLNNHLEQDDKGIKQRYRSTGGLRNLSHGGPVLCGDRRAPHFSTASVVPQPAALACQATSVPPGTIYPFNGALRSSVTLD
jgi:transposase-like protein